MGSATPIRDLRAQMARQNPSRGDTRIQGARANLRHQSGRGIIAKILRKAGLDSSPEVRNVNEMVDGFLRGSCYLIQDRGTAFSVGFRTVLSGVGVEFL